MTTVFKFYKDLEKYGIIKDSQFILNIPLELLKEIFDNSEIFHKQQIKRAFIDGEENVWDRHKNEHKFEFDTHEQYYQKTFCSKGSDGHELDDDIPPTSQYFPTSSQTEISDEEILKQGDYFFPNLEDVFRKDTWEMQDNNLK